MSMEFWITSLIVVLIPGTGVVYTVSNGLFRGWGAGVWASAGCTLGILPHLLASVLGLEALMHTSAVAFSLLKYAGVAYLLYLAWGMWRQKGSLEFTQATGGKTGWRILGKAFAMNILNPKLTLFFLAFLPQFVRPQDGPPLVPMLVLSGLFMLLTLVVFLAYGFLAHGVRAWVLRSPRFLTRLNKTFAVSLAALGIDLAFAEK